MVITLMEMLNPKRNVNVVIFMLAVFLYGLSQASAANIQLEWCHTGEPDVLFYNVYYDAGSFGPPYQGSGADQGPSPIQIRAFEVCNQETCSFQITGLTDSEMYYFAVTACDGFGNESPFTQENVCTGEHCFTKEPIPCPPIITGFSSPVGEPGTLIRISGINFGEFQGDGMVFVDEKEFGAGHRKIKQWSDTEIKIKLPKFKCATFNDQSLKELNIWITVDRDQFFHDSNERRLLIRRPYWCQ